MSQSFFIDRFKEKSNDELYEILNKSDDEYTLDREKAIKSILNDRNVDFKTSEEMDDLLLTTTNNFEGYCIKKYHQIVTSECVFGLNFFLDFFAGVSDVFGGRSQSTQEALRDARNNCINELQKEARKSNANAIVGIDIDYSEFSGKGKSMLFLVASGTAVTVEEVEVEEK